jgi:hypothetical protein
MAPDTAEQLSVMLVTFNGTAVSVAGATAGAVGSGLAITGEELLLVPPVLVAVME